MDNKITNGNVLNIGNISFIVHYALLTLYMNKIISLICIIPDKYLWLIRQISSYIFCLNYILKFINIAHTST